jgi:hypothetical protein
MGSRRR